MDVVRTKLGEGGRVVIPAVFRQDLHLVPGDDILIHMRQNTIYITTPDQALQKLQAKIKTHKDAKSRDISLVDELMAMRRLEVDRE